MARSPDDRRTADERRHGAGPRRADAADLDAFASLCRTQGDADAAARGAALDARAAPWRTTRRRAARRAPWLVVPLLAAAAAAWALLPRPSAPGRPPAGRSSPLHPPPATGSAPGPRPARATPDRPPSPATAPLLGGPDDRVAVGALGNSLAGPGRRGFPARLSALHVAGDGTVYALAGSADPGQSLSDGIVLRDGALVGRLGIDEVAGRTAGLATAGDDRHVFVAVHLRREPDRRPLLGVVRRHHRTGAPAPFPGGGGPDGSFLVVAEGALVRALAVAGGALFVAHDEEGGTISVFDAATLAPRRRFAAPAPRALVGDRAGGLWLAQGRPRPQVVRLRPDGGVAGPPLPGPLDPVALAEDPRGRLLVADGAREQILAFDHAPTSTAGPRLVQTFGEAGGIAATAGREAGPSRFQGLVAVGADADGTVYAAMNLAGAWGARLVALDPKGDVRWHLESLVSHESAAVDPTSDGREVYTKGGRFRLPDDGTAGPATLVGWTLDPARFPEDLRLDGGLHGSARIVRLQDRRLLVYETEVARLALFRFEEGRETAIPAVTVSDGAIWIDRDGDGRPQDGERLRVPLPWAAGASIDDDGTIWWASATEGIHRLPLAGWSTRGVPLYEPAARAVIPMPRPFVRLQRIVHVAARDVLYLAGYTTEHPAPLRGNARTALGTEIVRYDAWSSRPTVRWRLPLDTSSGRMRPAGFAVAESRLYLTHVNDKALRVLDAATAAPIGVLLPGPRGAGGLNTGRASLPLAAFERRDGTQLVFAASPTASRVDYFVVPPGWPE